MSYKNQSVMNSTGGSLTFSNTTNKEYVSLTHFGGANVVLNNNGFSLNSPQNYQSKVDNDSFNTVMGDYNLYHNKNSYERVNVDKHVIIGDSVALQTDAYGRWNAAFADITSINSQPEITVESFPIIPGVPLDTIPKTTESGTRLEDPAVSELKTKKILNGSTAIGEPKPPLNIGITAALQQATIQAQQRLKSQLTNQLTSLLDDNKKKLKGDSPSTQGGTYQLNPNRQQIPETIAATQEKLNEVEALMGEGGSLIENIARNKRVIVGAAVNSHPQAVVNPIGRVVPGMVRVDEQGSSTAVAGVPELSQVDNASVFPCGNYNIEVGNKFSVKVGGGGISLTSTSSVDVVSDAIVKIGSYQVIIGGVDVNIRGTENISIESDSNLNLTSSKQIVLNGNTGVNNNLIVKGGAYVDGEVFLNHITAPLEVQHTIPGFTADGARGFIRAGSQFTTTVTGGRLEVTGSVPGTITIVSGYLDHSIIESTTDFIELTPHAHEFPNIPITLTQSSGTNSAHGLVRSAGSAVNAPQLVSAIDIANGSKVDIGARTVSQTFNDISKYTYFT